MSTRSITVFRDGEENICAMYRQCDGYPEGIGMDFHNLLKGHSLCNGISIGTDNSKRHNGMGCLAAYIIGKMKKEIGGVYMVSVEKSFLKNDSFKKGDDSYGGAEYGYIISDKGGKINLKVVEIGYSAPGKVLFDGPIDKADFKGEEFQTAQKLANSA